MSTMWEWNLGLVEVAVRTSIVYVFLVLGMRIAGKRELGQLTPLDLVLLLTISNAVQNAMVGNHVSVSTGLVAAATLLLLNFLVSLLTTRSRKVSRWLEGTPTILLTGGKVLPESLHKERMTLEELEEAVREHGIASVEEVDLAVMEVDGTVSVIKYEESDSRSRTRRGFRQLKQKP